MTALLALYMSTARAAESVADLAPRSLPVCPRRGQAEAPPTTPMHRDDRLESHTQPTPLGFHIPQLFQMQRGMSQQTIDYVQSTNHYSQADISYLQSSMDSYAPADVNKHRGVQTFLKNTYNYDSPLYSTNCGVSHLFDDGRSLTGS